MPPEMRASVVWWSAGSGLALGLAMDALLVGLCAAVWTLLPVAPLRGVTVRWAAAAAVVLLVAVPACGAVLGYLEGRLKA